MIDADIRAVRFWGRLVRTALWLLLEPDQWYGRVRMFALMFAGGFVSRVEADRRRRWCDGSGPNGTRCPSRRTVDGIEFCMGPDTTCHGCPRSRWWWPNWLSTRRRLRRWGCPRGYWAPRWTWIETTRYGVLRAVVGMGRRMWPGAAFRRRQRHAGRAGRRPACLRARVDVLNRPLRAAG